MRRRSVPSESENVTINVTPIIDVALVLVIILMITAPMLAVPPLELELPPAKSKTLGNEPHVNVTLSRESKVAIDDEVMPRTMLRRELAAKFEKRDAEDRFLVVRADAGVQYAAVRALLEDARAAGATRIAVATRPHTEIVR
jgi:biopolymer transport protein ExbD